jgi:hypothetical protein
MVTINTLNADEVGFVYSKIKTAPIIGNANTLTTTLVYTSITENGSTVTAASLGGTYIFAFTVTGIPAKDVDTPFYVRAFSNVGMDIKYTKVVPVTVNTVQ